MPFSLISRSSLSDLASIYLERRRLHPEEFRGGGILSEERVIVPTRGIATWLEQRMVRSGVVVMGFEFPVLSQAFRSILGGSVKDFNEKAYSTSVLVWQLVSLLTDAKVLGSDEAFTPLKQYLDLEADADSRIMRAFQLAQKLAALYDQYQSYLYRTLASWARGENLDSTIEKAGTPVKLPKELLWQSHLWHRLRAGCGQMSLAEAIEHFLTTPPGDGAQMQPLTVFGATMMPPAYLEILVKYGEAAPVNFYYHNPCRDFWGDNQSTRRKDPLQEDDLQNDLLADYGRQAQQFFNAVIDLCGDTSDTEALPEEPDAGTLLGAMQQLIRGNRNPVGKREFADDSVTIHKCHNQARQVEALRDSLLMLLKKGNAGGKPAYTMNDIIVMAPNIVDFAPTIKAVFDASPLKDHYAVTDRSIRKSNLLAESFLQILLLTNSRFEVTRIDALLDAPALRRRFAFGDADVIAIRSWLDATKVHFGFDGASRADAFGIPVEQAAGIEEFTWLQALDRMLLALAVEPSPVEEENATSFGGLSPYPAVGADSGIQALGNLSMLVHKLHDTVVDLRSNSHRTAQDWGDLLSEILDTFFTRDSESARDMAIIEGKLRDFVESVNNSSMKEKPIPFQVVLSTMQDALETASTAGVTDPFLGGRITCCSMMPMRGVPCKIMALLGMDEGKFPRQELHLGFNLINDGKLLPYYVRSKTDEDRYLFLEALLAPSDNLLVFYNAFDEEDKAPLAPSTVISQLISYVNRIADKPQIEVIHTLNSFDINNFRKQDAPLPSTLRDKYAFDASSRRIAQAALEAKRRPDTKCDEGGAAAREIDVGEPEELPEAITIRDLERLIEDGGQAFLQHALGFNRDDNEAEPLSDHEPFQPSSLDKWVLYRDICDSLKEELGKEAPCLDAGSDQIGRLKDKMRSTGQLLIGDVGELEMREALETIRKSHEQLPDIGGWARGKTINIEAKSVINGRTIAVTGACEVDDEDNPTAVYIPVYGMPGTDGIKEKYLVKAYLRLLVLSLQRGASTGLCARILAVRAPGSSMRMSFPKYLGADGGQPLQGWLDRLVGEFLASYRRPVMLKDDFSWRAVQTPNKKKSKAEDDEPFGDEWLFPGKKNRDAMENARSLFPMVKQGPLLHENEEDEGNEGDEEDDIQ